MTVRLFLSLFLLQVELPMVLPVLMLFYARPVELRCDVAKKKKDLPVFVVIDMPVWKSRIFDFMLKLLRVPGKAWVIGVEYTGLTYDGDAYEDKATGIKIDKKDLKNEQRD
jgi:hypothetical protein